MSNEWGAWVRNFKNQDSTPDFVKAKIVDWDTWNEAKARMLVEQLYRYFCENPDKMPEFYYKNTANDSVGRCVCDYISGMTDRYAVALYKDLFVPKEWETPEITRRDW